MAISIRSRATTGWPTKSWTLTNSIGMEQDRQFVCVWWEHLIRWRSRTVTKSANYWRISIMSISQLNIVMWTWVWVVVIQLKSINVIPIHMLFRKGTYIETLESGSHLISFRNSDIPSTVCIWRVIIRVVRACNRAVVCSDVSTTC